MLREDVDPVVEALKARGWFAQVHHASTTRVGVRVVLPGGREAIWDVDGAAGLEAMVLRDGVLVGFVPKIEGSENFTRDQCVDAIAAADYGPE